MHSLKGAHACMIGAHRLQQRASQLENAIRTEASDQRELLASLTPEFQRVLLLLDVLLEGSPPVGVVVQVPSRPLLEDSALLNRLMELLSNGDGAAVDLLEESSASLRVILGEATLQRVAEAINDFDFDEALEVLGETSA
ncbi:Hpt domain-containing protein [Massilia sp. H-1]|nr:Hpt domain-containing protein [Massilia sp. H-1]